MSDQEVNAQASEYIERLFKIRQELSELTEQEKKYKVKIMSYLDKNELTAYDTGEYLAKYDQRQKGSISKDDLPEEIWEKYKRVSRFKVLTIKDKQTIRPPRAKSSKKWKF